MRFISDSPDARPVFLRRDHYQGLALRLPAAHSLLQTAQISFVHFHPPRQSITARSYHRSPELVQPRPRRFVAAQPQHPLQPQSTGTVFLAGQPIHGPEPVHQRLARVLENRARGHRRLVTTRLALHQPRPHRPEVPACAARAAKAFRPSQPEQVVPARLLGIKPSLEFAQIPWIVLHTAPYYILGLPESSKYPPSGILMPACIGHQTKRANGAGQHADQSRPAEAAIKHTHKPTSDYPIR